MRKWAAIAFVATLTLAGQGAPNFNFGNAFSSSGKGGASPFPSVDDAKAFFMAHLAVIIAVAVVAVALLFCFYLLARWINSRAQFMLFDNVVRNDDRIKAAWRENKELGNSLFRFRIMYDLLIFNMFLLAVAVTGGLAWPDIRDALMAGEYHFGGWSLAAVIFGIIGMVVASLATWVLASVVFDLAVPVMYIRRMEAWPAVKVAWRELFRPHLGSCLLYMLFLIVVRMAQGMWMFAGTMVLMLVTCCTIALVMIIPIVGIFPMVLVGLPPILFERAYKLYFVSQFGEAYQVNWQSVHLSAFPVVLNDPAAGAPWVPPEPPLK